jgi:flagellar motor protein MotB
MKTNYLKGILLLLLLALFVLTGSVVAFAQDIEGSKDHLLIKRYPGSTIAAYEAREFGEFKLPLGKAKNDTDLLEKSQTLEGKLTRIIYWMPSNRSPLEVFRNFETALTKAGFTSLFNCKGNECGPLNGYLHNQWKMGGVYSNDPDQRYTAAKLSRPEGDVYVALHVDPRFILLAVIEMKSMQTGLVTVDAAAMAGDISRSGHVAVYGIYFDFNKADMKPQSEPAIKQIATLLKQDPKLKLHVVGHTDSVGDLKSNMDLSRRRADAVVKEVTTKHGIAAARLRADGVGPLSPVASNKTEDGRAKNRRVELVEQ